MAKNWRKYLLWFAQEHVDFRLAEFNSLVKLFNLEYSPNINEISTDEIIKPFWIVQFPSEEAALSLASRSIALRGICELWSHGNSFEAFHENLKYYLKSNGEELEKYFIKENSFKISVEVYNKHFQQREKIEKIESLDYLPVQGNADLRNPKIEWWYIEFWGLDPLTVPDSPENIFFGRLLANGQRHLINELSLKKRKFIGNTSMDTQLSLLMANQALVRRNHLVFDPFVGTGSLLVSAAKFGAYVLGGDIDYMMLHAKAKPSRIQQKVRERNESVLANLEQYGCASQYMDVVVADFSHSLWHPNLKLDSIITDPPYGVREATEKVQTKPGKRKEGKKSGNSSDCPHYPSTSHYSLHQLYSDLLQFSAKHLKLEGRLVCWLPLHTDDCLEELMPRHPNLDLVASSEQKLSSRVRRFLLTYEKHSEPSNAIIGGNVEVERIGNKTLPLPSSEMLSANSEMNSNRNLNFRDRYFINDVETRQERKMRKALLKEEGIRQALNRGKILENGRVIRKLDDDECKCKKDETEEVIINDQ